MYRAALRDSETFVYYIDPRTAVAQIYDPITHDKGLGVDAWVVLQSVFSVNTGRTSFTCCKWCPDKARYNEACLHELALNANDSPTPDPVSQYDNPSAVAFRWTPPSDDAAGLIIFCVMSSRADPSIVAFNGFYANAGVWSCKKCRGVSSCLHIDAAFKIGYHEELLPLDDSPGMEDNERNKLKLEQHLAALRAQTNRNSLRDLNLERSVSFKPIGSPRWCRLDSDPISTPSVVRPRRLPKILQLGLDARCRCGAPPLHSFKATLVPCTVYQSHRATQRRVWVKPCSRCPVERNMFAGPDLRHLGIFNLNNSRMFAHDLLNEYTTAMSAMEAPFHAFVEVVKKRYIDAGCRTRFAGEDSFRTAWFSRSRLLHSFDSMHCETCGENPECIIFDGQSGGFDADLKTSLLRPPTTVLPDSSTRMAATRHARDTAAVQGAVGKRARLAIRWRQSLAANGQSRLQGITVADVIDDPADADQEAERSARQQKTRVSKRDASDAAMRASLDGIARELETTVCSELSAMFRTFVVASYDNAKEEVRQLYLNLLAQIFAYESILQFMPEHSFNAVHWLLADDEDAAAALLGTVPALGVIARLEIQTLGRYTRETKRIAAWLMERSATVRAKLPTHEPDPPRARFVVADIPKTGSCWGRPRIRSRPSYPNLQGDSKTDRAVVTEELKAAGIGCSKYYETYGIHGQTGGILAAWCP
ncbi:hypothetical protein BKA62DRAFT_600832, partial [Auriculariales sp. MPI-PUGE-AT-0066]